MKDMKFSTYITLLLTIIVSLFLLGYFELVTIQDQLWWTFVLVAFLLLHGVKDNEKEFKWISKHFSKPFKQTYKYVFLFWATFIWVGGIADLIYLEFLSVTTAEFIYFLIFTIISLYLIPLLVTYLIRLVLPFFKKVHDKANK